VLVGFVSWCSNDETSLRLGLMELALSIVLVWGSLPQAV
jgi:hypothetical protein